MTKKTMSAEEKAAKKQEDKGRRTWKLIGRGIGLVSGLVAMKALDATWHTATGHKPPTDPENPDIGSKEALVWAAISGMALGLARTYATRRAAQYWIRSFGSVPPGMSEASDADKRALKRSAAK